MELFRFGTGERNVLPMILPVSLAGCTLSFYSNRLLWEGGPGFSLSLKRDISVAN